MTDLPTRDDRRPRHGFSPLSILRPGLMARQDFLGQTALVVVVQLVLLLVAVSIDLARYFDQVMSAVADAGFAVRALLLSRYLGLRIVDMVTRLLPIAVFVGVLLFEVRSIVTRRRVIHWISGRHPLRVLAPAAAVGLVFGLLQYQLDTRWRPAAVLTQATEHLGAYGERYDRVVPRKDVWFLFGDRLLHSQVRFGPPAELVDVDLFRLDGAGRIAEVLRAPRAEPTGSADTWRFVGAGRWTRAGDDTLTMRVAVLPGDELVRMPLPPLAVTYLGMPAKYIPEDDLEAIVASGTDVLIGADHRTWIEVRRANALMPLAMALLAAVVSLFAGASRPGVPVMIGCVAAGYTLHVAVRVFVAAGELDRIAPFTAAWVPVLTALAAIPLLAAAGALRGWRS